MATALKGLRKLIGRKKSKSYSFAKETDREIDSLSADEISKGDLFDK